MGKRNREKRAAKKRARQRQGPTEPSGGFGPERHGPGCGCGDPGNFFSPPPQSPIATLSQVLLAAAQAHANSDAASGDATAAAACAAQLSGGRFAREQRTVGMAAEQALGEVVAALWQAGWLPADLWHIARRKTDAAATSLLVDTIAADTATHALAAIHERWLAQVHQLDATVWWQRDQPHLGQWAQRRGLDFEQALLTTITLLAQLMTLPELPRILPSPGTVMPSSHQPRTSVEQKILSRVRALLAKAESTQFPEEAEALSSKAQELMHRYAFQRALLDVDEHAPPTVTSIRLWLDAPYVEAKSHLVAAIAEANRCQRVYYPKLGFVALVGEHLDLEITELLATSLLVQATRAMVAEGSQVTRAGVSHTRSFRQSFLVSYATRIGERLTDASARAHDSTDDARLLPVLADRSRAVDEAFHRMFSHTVQKSVSVTNGAGWHAGRAAADRADLTVDRHAVST